MSLAEYSLIFITILVGYIVTVTMVGWGKLIKHYDYRKFPVLYLVWSLSLFLYLLFIWFWNYKGYKGNLDFLDQPIALYSFIIRLLIIYFAIETLAPEKNDGYDFNFHFHKISKRFYILLVILWSYELLLYPMTGHLENLFSLNLRSALYLACFPISLALLFVKGTGIQTVLAVINFAVIVLANIIELEYL